MLKTKRMIFKAFLIVFTAWFVVSAVWFAWSRITYSRYCDGMIQNELSNLIVPRYYAADDDYTYLVKYPNYLSLTGNLGITPKDESKNVVGFLIWPTGLGKTEYGLIIEEEMKAYQIYTDSNGKPIDAEYQDMASRHADEVNEILQAADAMWGKYKFQFSGQLS